MKANISVTLLLIFVCCVSVSAQTTEFTYQGRLTDTAGTAASYDFEFKLFSAPNDIVVLGTQTRLGVPVSGNVFTVQLDFGGQFDGTARYLEIGVKPAGSGGAFTALTPRQPITSAPYAVRSLNAATALNSTQLGGVEANQFVQTNDTRLSDDRNPLAGSTNYVQNTNSPQAASNFNISGNGTVGGTLAGNAVNAATQYNIGGNRVLSVAGTDNIFAGVGAGTANTTGNDNSFFGRSAGSANTTGDFNSFFGHGTGIANTIAGDNSFFGAFAGSVNTSGRFNSFFGRSAGDSNTTGEYNSFFGRTAGISNTISDNNSFFGGSAGASSTGNDNSFFGKFAGLANTTGSNNTAIGSNSMFGASNLTFATAIGAGAVGNTSNSVTLGRNLDTVQIPGNLNVTGTFTANINGASLTNLNASNISAGTLNNARLGIVPVANGGTGSATQNFVDLTNAQTIAGNKTFSNTLAGNIVQTASTFNVGTTPVVSIAGVGNTFVGPGVGTSNTGTNNAFVGSSAGSANSSGSSNAFFGTSSGSANTTGTINSFFGTSAGRDNTIGHRNSFFGAFAGARNANDSSDNSFFGYNSGLLNTSGDQNSFFGSHAGEANTQGSFNSFFGYRAGEGNISGINNAFFGTDAGNTNTTGSNNTLVGQNADVFFSNLSFATAIGADASVSASNTIALGRANGEDGVRIPGNLTIAGNLTIGILGTAIGAVPICRNVGDFISTCGSSSLRYKTNIGNFNPGIDIVKRLRPITFDWKEGGLHDFGLAAEDVAAVEPLLATYNKDGQIEGVKYDRISVVLINAVKEQQAQIERQEKRIEDQDKRFEQQARQIAGMRALLCAAQPNATICNEKDQ